jgi:hypothetical protein
MGNATQISTSVTIISSLLGFQAISLTDYTTSALSLIAAGSKCEVGGAFFNFATDCTPNSSSWTAITTATTAYLALTPSGTAGSQILTASYTSAAPKWRNDYQGWYASAASTTRVIAYIYKSGTSSQAAKTIFYKGNRNLYYSSILEIGYWNMDTTTSVSVLHYLPDHYIVAAEITIIDDSPTDDVYKLEIGDGSIVSGVTSGYFSINETSFIINRSVNGFFDSVNFDTPNMNRGYINITYNPFKAP